MSKKRFIELLTKRDCGDITLLEQKELADLVRENEQLASMLPIFDDFNKKGFQFTQAAPTNVEHSWDYIEKRLESDIQESVPKRAPFLYSKKIMIAASLLAIILISAVVLINSNKKAIINSEKNIVVTKKGSKSYLVLPDGTQVWLNDATQVSYDKTFGEKTREVLLSGEAYFDVAKNPAKPFIVHTSVMDVTALGTSFNVHAYENSERTEALLIEGSVEVMLKADPNKKIILKPFEKISVQNTIASGEEKEERKLPSEIFSLRKIEKKKDSLDTEETLWIRNKLVFANRTLEEIALRLSRWYDVEIEITDPQLKQTKYSAEFDDISLKEVMESLKLAGGFDYTVKNKKIVITP